MKILKICVLPAIFALSACLEDPETAATRTDYTPAELSELKTLKPFPTPDDVCLVVDPDASLDEFVKVGHLLIACPKHERGAIEDRKAEGARFVANRTHWSVFSIKA